MSQFSFLEAEFAEQFEPAKRAEGYALSDPSASIIYARKALESMVKWVFRGMPAPFVDKLNAYLHTPELRQVRSGSVFEKTCGADIALVAVVDPCGMLGSW